MLFRYLQFAQLPWEDFTQTLRQSDLSDLAIDGWTRQRKFWVHRAAELLREAMDIDNRFENTKIILSENDKISLTDLFSNDSFSKVVGMVDSIVKDLSHNDVSRRVADLVNLHPKSAKIIDKICIEACRRWKNSHKTISKIQETSFPRTFLWEFWTRTTQIGILISKICRQTPKFFPSLEGKKTFAEFGVLWFVQKCRADEPFLLPECFKNFNFSTKFW